MAPFIDSPKNNWKLLWSISKVTKGRFSLSRPLGSKRNVIHKLKNFRIVTKICYIGLSRNWVCIPCESLTNPSKAPFTLLRITCWSVSQVVRTGPPSTLLIVTRSKTDTVRRIISVPFNKGIKSNPGLHTNGSKVHTIGNFWATFTLLRMTFWSTCGFWWKVIVMEETGCLCEACNGCSLYFLASLIKNLLVKAVHYMKLSLHMFLKYFLISA